LFYIHSKRLVTLSGLAIDHYDIQNTRREAVKRRIVAEARHVYASVIAVVMNNSANSRVISLQMAMPARCKPQYQHFNVQLEQRERYVTWPKPIKVSA